MLRLKKMIAQLVAQGISKNDAHPMAIQALQAENAATAKAQPCRGGDRRDKMTKAQRRAAHRGYGAAKVTAGSLEPGAVL